MCLQPEAIVSSHEQTAKNQQIEILSRKNPLQEIVWVVVDRQQQQPRQSLAEGFCATGYGAAILFWSRTVLYIQIMLVDKASQAKILAGKRNEQL
jgi:hypothetical protein